MKKSMVLMSIFLIFVIIGFFYISAREAKSTYIELSLRNRMLEDDELKIFHEERELLANETAIIIIDMWEEHWCSGAAGRIEKLAPKINSFVEKARVEGIQIIHAPSGTMNYYQNDPHRKKMLQYPDITWYLKEHKYPPLPIEVGCDTGEAPYEFFKGGQHPVIEIKDDDVISDKGAEIYEFLIEKKIKHVFIVGVASNACILTKPFGIFSLRTLGFEPILIRDLTDSMHSAEIDHERANTLVIEWIEQYGCSTVDSSEVINGFNKR